jgi:hypothetical protein
MISAALEFVHARKWLVELLLLGVIVVGVVLFCRHLIQVGVERQRAEDERAYRQLQLDAAIESGRLKGIAEKASHEHDEELQTLREYRVQHPLHGGLCLDDGRKSRLPNAGTAESGDAGRSSSAESLQPVSSGDSQPSGQSDPDIRGMLDALAGRADRVSAQLREFQARER